MSNLANGSHETFEKLEKDPNLDVLEYGCLSYCTICAKHFMQSSMAKL